MNQASTTWPVRAVSSDVTGRRADMTLPRRTWRRRMRGRYRWMVLFSLLAAVAGGALGWVGGDWLHHRQLVQLAEARRQQEELQQRLQALDRRIAAATASIDEEQLALQIEIRSDELRRLEALLSDTRIALASAVPLPEPVLRGEPGRSREYLDRLARADADLRLLLDQRGRAQRQLNALRRRMGPSAAEVVAASNEVARADASIERHLRSARAVSAGAGVPLTADELAERLQRLTQLRDEARQAVSELRDTDAAVRALMPQHEEVQQALDEVRARIDALATAATDGQTALRRSRLQGAALGAVLGLIPGLAVAPLITLMRDGRIRRPEAAELGDPAAPLFGAVPALSPQAMATDASDLTALSIHEIRAVMQIRAERDGARAFALTSPGRGAGKTSLTVGLASSLAMSGTRTLLVDCDLVGRARPSEKPGEAAADPRQNLDQVMLQMGYLDGADPEIFLLSHDTSVGITGMLEGEPLEHCVIETSVPGLSILPALAATPQHIGRMSTGFVRRLIEEARRSYDMIVFDTGPVPGSVEALVVTSAADATILVVPRGERRSQLERAVSHLRMAGANLAGTVFNRAANQDVSVDAGDRTKKEKRKAADARDLKRSATVRNITGSGILAAAVHTQASSAIPAAGGGTRPSRDQTERRRTPPGQRDAQDEDVATLADTGDIAAILRDEAAAAAAPKPKAVGWRAAAAMPAAPADAPRTTDPELESALDELVNDARSAPGIRKQA